MGWDLTVLVDPADSAGVGALLVAWAESFGGGLAEAHLRGGRGDGPHRAIVRGAVEVREALAEWAARHVRDDGALDVELRLAVEGDPLVWPAPVALACGPQHPGPQGAGRRMPVLLGFGDRRAYAEGARLAGGVVLDDLHVRRTLESVCRAHRPRTLLLEEEQATGLIINAHMVYHRDLGGFEQDVRDLARMVLHGGAGLDGALAGIPRLADALQSIPMVFAGREQAYSRELVRFLEAHAAAVLDSARPWALTRETMEQALLESEDIDFFQDGDGVGVTALPFLAVGCEDPFLALVELLAGGAHG